MIDYYFAIIIILEIVSIILGKKYYKFFNVFDGLHLGLYISIFLYRGYTATDIFSYDTGSWIWLGARMILFVFIILNIIVGIVGIILQIKTKNKQSLKFSHIGIAILCALLVSLITFVNIYTVYTSRVNEKERIESEAKSEVLNHLKSKYGTSDFEIESISWDFADNGLIGTDLLENYDLYVIYKPDNIRFYVDARVDLSRNIVKDKIEDWLVFYYSEKYFRDSDFADDTNQVINELGAYLQDKGFNLEIGLYSDYVVGLDNNEAVPSDYGKIPSKEELYDLILDYHIKHDLEIQIAESEIKSDDLKSEIREYLINLSNQIINYYTDLNEYEVFCHYENEAGKFFNGSLIINQNSITIDGNLLKETIQR